MKTYDESLIEVIRETEHYAMIFHPAIKDAKEKDVIFFFEWLHSLGYRYLYGDNFAARYVMCEKMAKPYPTTSLTASTSATP